MDLRTSETQEHTVETWSAANSSFKATGLDTSHLGPGESGRWVAYCRFISEGRVISRNRLFLTGFGFNALQMPKARFSHRIDGGVLSVKAHSYAWQVRIEVPAGLEADDNHFDLLPGEKRRVRMRGPENLLRGVEARALNE